RTPPVRLDGIAQSWSSPRSVGDAGQRIDHGRYRLRSIRYPEISTCVNMTWHEKNRRANRDRLLAGLLRPARPAERGADGGGAQGRGRSRPAAHPEPHRQPSQRRGLPGAVHGSARALPADRQPPPQGAVRRGLAPPRAARELGLLQHRAGQDRKLAERPCHAPLTTEPVHRTGRRLSYALRWAPASRSTVAAVWRRSWTRICGRPASARPRAAPRSPSATCSSCWRPTAHWCRLARRDAGDRRAGAGDTGGLTVPADPSMRDFEYKWTPGYKIGTPPPPSGLSRSTMQTPEAEPATARVACWATADDKRAANSAPFRGSDGSSPGRRAVAEDADPASHHARPPSDRRLATLLLPDPERRVRRFLFLYANDF